MVRFSQLVAEQRWIKEIDINPLSASADRLISLDARVVLHDLDTIIDKLPGLAIRPYPSQYVQPWTLNDGEQVLIRPIRPEDEPLMIQFHKTLSDHSVYMRYFHQIHLSQRVAHERLARICFIDYEQDMALVVDHRDPVTNEHEILGVGRLSKLHGKNEAEFAIVIADKVQRRGLGTELLHRLLEIGQDQKVQRITGTILAENDGMRRICEKLQFHLSQSSDFKTVQAEINLGSAKEYSGE